MNTKRNKNRSNSVRSPKSRGNERSLALDGVYNNSYFMNSVTSLIGNVINVHTSTGAIYEGIFRTFSVQFEVVVELAHKVDPLNRLHIPVDSVVDKIIFKAQDIIKLEIIDVDMDYATRDTFQTDTNISKFNGQVTEKELEPWDASGNNVDDFELDGATSNGWDVNDMFRQNEQMYGVTSNFDHRLSGYTTSLQNKDSKDYKDAEAKAIKIAKEIENNPVYKTRIDLENGEEEEEKYAAVLRPTSSESSPNNEGNKYVCPPKRKTLQTSKSVRAQPTNSQPPTCLNNNSATNVVNTPPNPPAFIQHHPSVSHSNSNSRERINGVTETPKPQRTPLTTRHARSFGNNETTRFTPNASNVVPPTTNTSVNSPTTPVGDSRNTTNHNHATYTPNNVLSTTESHHHRKPPPVLQHPAPPEQHQLPLSINIPRKISRGREDQISELKQFQTNFKLNDAQSDDKKTSVKVNTEPEHQSVTTIASNSLKIESTSEVPSPRPSSGGNTTEPPDPKIIKSKLNPNAKEFIYNPNAKPFTPRSDSTPPQPRPHTPQTPGYGGPVPQQIPAMVMPTYVVTTAQPPYPQQPNQANRYRKMHMGISQPSQMQVAAATGQPLLAPAPMHTQFTVPYSPQAHITPQPYQQMVRMVAQQGGGMVPPVLTAINYPPDGSQQTQMQFMGPGSMGPHPHHPPHVHPSQNTASSPQSNNGQMANPGSGGGGNSSGGPPYQSSPANSYSQPPPGAPHPPNQHYTYPPLLYPMLPAHPPQHPASQQGVPHHMIAAATQPSVQSYIHHHHPPHQHSSAVGNQQHHIQVILPHSQ